MKAESSLRSLSLRTQLIFPDKTAQQKLAEALDACRWLHNRLLQELNEAKEKGIKLKTYDTQNMIPSLKLENPKLNLVYSKVLHHLSVMQVLAMKWEAAP
jgi:hypothetical protein